MIRFFLLTISVAALFLLLFAFIQALPLALSLKAVLYLLSIFLTFFLYIKAVVRLGALRAWLS